MNFDQIRDDQLARFLHDEYQQQKPPVKQPRKVFHKVFGWCTAKWNDELECIEYETIKSKQ